MVRVRNVICIALAVLLAGAILWMMYVRSTEEAERQRLYDEVAAEARPYEIEVQRLREELEQMADGTVYAGECGSIMMGFVPEAASDFEKIETWADLYGFSPVIILDCSGEIEDLKQLADEAKAAKWEIMLTASSYADDVHENIVAMRAYIASIKAEDTGVFLIRNGYSSDKVISQIKKDGFIGYTVYSTYVPSSGQDEDGCIYFEYYYVSSDTSAVYSKLGYLYEDKTAMIIAIDMHEANEGVISREYLTNLMETTEEYDGYDDCRYAAVAEVAEELNEVNDIESENWAEYEKSAVGVQERIDELEEVIAEIWEKYGEE